MTTPSLTRREFLAAGAMAVPGASAALSLVDDPKSYHPLPGQARFHADPSNVRLLRGGNRSGKTTAAAWEAAQCARKGGRRILVVVPSMSHAGFLYEFLFERNHFGCGPLIGGVKNIAWFSKYQKEPLRVDLSNGSAISFLNGDRASTLFGKYDLVWVDSEPRDCSSLVDIAVQQGRRNQKFIWTLHPSNHAADAHASIVERAGGSEHVLRFEDNVHIPKSVRKRVSSCWGEVESSQRNHGLFARCH